MDITAFTDLADKLEAEARSIRARVGRAGSASQSIMRAEAAALERSARDIRAEVARQQPTDFWSPLQSEHRPAA
jgi:hypothetical protein